MGIIIHAENRFGNNIHYKAASTLNFYGLKHLKNCIINNVACYVFYNKQKIDFFSDHIEMINQLLNSKRQTEIF